MRCVDLIGEIRVALQIDAADEFFTVLGRSDLLYKRERVKAEPYLNSVAVHLVNAGQQRLNGVEPLLLGELREIGVKVGISTFGHIILYRTGSAYPAKRESLQTFDCLCKSRLDKPIRYLDNLKFRTFTVWRAYRPYWSC